VAFAEADLNWVPGALQTAEMTYDCYVGLLEPELQHRPTHYWHRNCYATFQYDPIELDGRERSHFVRGTYDRDRKVGQSRVGLTHRMRAFRLDSAHQSLG
jgi:hypothetical protein